MVHIRNVPIRVVGHSVLHIYAHRKSAAWSAGNPCFVVNVQPSVAGSDFTGPVWHPQTRLGVSLDVAENKSGAQTPPERGGSETVEGATRGDVYVRIWLRPSRAIYGAKLIAGS